MQIEAVVLYSKKSIRLVCEPKVTSFISEEKD